MKLKVAKLFSKKIVNVIVLTLGLGSISVLYTNTTTLEDSFVAKLDGFKLATYKLNEVYSSLPGVGNANFKERQTLLKTALSNNGFNTQVLNAGQILILDLQKAGFTVMQEKGDPYTVYITGGSSQLGKEIAQMKSGTGAKFGISVVNNIIQSVDLTSGSSYSYISLALDNNLISLSGAHLRNLRMSGDTSGVLAHEGMHIKLKNDLDFLKTLFADSWYLVSTYGAKNPNYLASSGGDLIKGGRIDLAGKQTLTADFLNSVSSYWSQSGFVASEVESYLAGGISMINKGFKSEAQSELGRAVYFAAASLSQTESEIAKILAANFPDTAKVAMQAGAEVRLSYQKQMLAKIKSVAAKGGVDISGLDNFIAQLFPSGLPATSAEADAKAAKLIENVDGALEDLKEDAADQCPAN